MAEYKIKKRLGQGEKREERERDGGHLLKETGKIRIDHTINCFNRGTRKGSIAKFRHTGPSTF